MVNIFLQLCITAYPKLAWDRHGCNQCSSSSACFGSCTDHRSPEIQPRDTILSRCDKTPFRSNL